MPNVIPHLAETRLSAVQEDQPLSKQQSSPKAAAGLLLLNSLLCPVSFNAEAMEILSYPNRVVNLAHAHTVLATKIHSRLLRRETRGALPFVTEFRSGRRRYFCRAFFVESSAKDPSHPSIAVLLERGPSVLAPVSLVSQQFNLTPREQEVLEYLLQGLASRAIASRMNISPNTVKAFLRMIMIKTGVSSRAEMVRKIILAQPL